MKFVLSSYRDAWVRYLLLGLSVTIAYLLFGTLVAFERAYTSGADVGALRMVTTNKLSFTKPLPRAYFDEVRSLDGVGASSFAAWFGGYFQEPRNRLHTIAVEPASYLQVYGDDLKISPQERAAFISQRDTFLVGEALAARFGWQVGDQVPVINKQIERQDGVASWKLRLAGIVRGSTAFIDTSFVYIHYDLLNEARAYDRDTIGWIISAPAPGQDPSLLAETIDRLFDLSVERTTTDSERSFALTFVAQFGDLAAVTTMVLGAAFVSLLVILATTTTLAINQRHKEIGVLKALGYSQSRILLLFVGENLLIVVTAGVLGLIAAAWLVGISSDTMASIAPGIELTGGMFFSGLLSLLVLGALASGPATLRGIRTPTATALRKG
ncbi:MAG: FtsX-like permease family protein [Pseudomonadota bacterium]